MAGSSVIAPTSSVCGIDATGHLKSNVDLVSACQVWGNDVISPTGTAYEIIEYPNGAFAQDFQNALIVGSSLDLSNVTFQPSVRVFPDLTTLTLSPLTVSLLPNQDNLYSLGASGDRFSQAYVNNAFINSFGLTPSFSGLATFSGGLNTKTLNNIPKCEQYGTPGVTAFQTLMAACVAALPATGPSIVDATNITDATNLTMTGNWTMSRSGTEIRFGQYTINQGTNQVIVPSPTSNIKFACVAGFGTTPSGIVNGTYFKYTGSASAHSFGDASATSYGHVVEDCAFDLTSATGSAVAITSTRVYGAEFNRNRGLAPVTANAMTFIINNGTNTAPGSQSMTLRGNVESNFQIGFQNIGSTSPPLSNHVQFFAGQFSGNSAAGGICVDIENGALIDFYEPYCSGYDTGLKVASPSQRAVWGVFHSENCTTQGFLFTAATANNNIWSDNGAANNCAIVTDSGMQNQVHGSNIATGTDYVYGALYQLGTTNFNRFKAPIQFFGNAGLPAGTASTLYIAGGYSSPILGKIYVGDGTGWQLNFSKRTGSVDTELWQMKDSGVFTGPIGNAVQTVASGTAAMTTAAITAGTCGTTVTVAATNVLTTDTITWAFNAAPAGTNAGLVAWPTANNVNFAYCGIAETPAAATINWRVVR